MQKSDTLRLDTHALLERIRGAGIKQYVLAERLGVHPRSISRWVTGQVKRISRDNLDRLATALGCTAEALLLSGELDAMATREEQRRAAGLIADCDLLHLLSPSDNWRLAEQLVKATVQPDLPASDLGRLYNLLSIATWRQGNYGDARNYAEYAAELGERSGTTAVVLKAVFNQAVIDSFEGRNSDALRRYEYCAANLGGFERRRDHGSTLANLSMTYRDFTRFSEALKVQRKAIRIFRGAGESFNLAISFAMTALIMIESGDFRGALKAANTSARHAVDCKFSRQLDQLEFVMADAQSLRGDTEPAAERIQAALPRLGQHSGYDYQVHETAARVFRRAGAIDEAWQQSVRGLEKMGQWPMMQAMMYQEQARLHQLAGYVKQEQTCLESANRIFRHTGLMQRVRSAPVAEYGAMFADGA